MRELVARWKEYQIIMLWRNGWQKFIFVSACGCLPPALVDHFLQKGEVDLCLKEVHKLVFFVRKGLEWLDSEWFFHRV